MNKYVLVAVIMIALLGISLLFKNKGIMQKQEKVHEIRYVALGDSYTIGEGASEAESWPSLLTNHLQKEGIQIQLIANPSVTGWTTQQVIDNELPVYDNANPTFATLLIGVNDWVQGVDKETFHHNLVIILDHMQLELPKKDNLILVTIPDFSVTPTGKQYSNSRDIAKGIAGFNAIIVDEAKKRNIPIVDIYPLTQAMKNNPELIAPDGLHPTAKEYTLWEQLIYPVVFRALHN